MRFIIKKQADGDHYFRIVSGGNFKTLSHSEGYENESDCRHAIQLIKDEAAGADVDED